MKKTIAESLINFGNYKKIVINFNYITAVNLWKLLSMIRILEPYESVWKAFGETSFGEGSRTFNARVEKRKIFESAIFPRENMYT